MDFDVHEWCAEFLRKMEGAFGGALVFAGLQGSRGRGEAKDWSDIDLVVVLKELTPRELGLYAEVLASMPFAEKACGFICGEPELRAWSASELFLLYHDTTPLCGSLDFIAPLIDGGAAKKAPKTEHARYTTAAAATGFTRRALTSLAFYINQRFSQRA